MRRYELTDGEWKKIQPLCTGKPSDVGRTAKDNRLFINAVLFMVRSGCAWRDLPERYGKWNTVYQRFNRWAKRGRWKAIFEVLRQTDAPDLACAMIDSPSIWVHQQAAGQKKPLTNSPIQKRVSAGVVADGRPSFTQSLMHYRRIATRYDKTARNFLVFIYLASSLMLLSSIIVNTT